MDSFFVMAQPRSGSTLLSVALYEYVKLLKKDNSLLEYLGGKDKVFKNYTNYCVYHCHFFKNLQYVPKNFTIVYTYRDLFESVISTCVGNSFLNESGWNIWDRSRLLHLNENKPINIPLKDYRKYTSSLINFHIDTQKELKRLEVEYHKINYNEFKNDPNVIFQKLNINYTMSQNDIKNSFPAQISKSLNYQEMIINYYEIKEYVKNLEETFLNI